MPRVIGIDLGTISIDVCGLDDGRLFLDQSLSTQDALTTSALIDVVAAAGPVDLVAGPSGYGLPLVQARDASDDDLRLACLAPEGVQGGIGGLRSLMRALARVPAPVVFTPGVIHLPTVPAFRKVNRVDLGTADKLCAVVLALADASRNGTPLEEASFILVELGGAFSAAVAVQHGRVVDGIGGTSGPIGMRAAGALDGEVAYLIEHVTKDTLFQGGAAFVAGGRGEWPPEPLTPRSRLAWDAFVEQAAKAIAALAVSAPDAHEVLLSGRSATTGMCDLLLERLAAIRPQTRVRALGTIAAVAKHAAQGAALMADGLAGGRCAAIVEHLGLREASGTVLDHLTVIGPEAARRRLGMQG